MSSAPAHTWIEPFTPRETEILRLIEAGFSNPEIAHKLHLSSETVKWYNKQIFSKLGVKSRTLAVARAREYRLLSASEVPPTEEIRRAAHNLPAQLTSFVGRSQEIEDVKQLLKTSRLVVLTGPGGTGKTRLALETAAQLTSSYRDGAWLVELAPLREAALVPDAIAQVLHEGIRGNAPAIEILKHSLRNRHLLLLLDNFEHLPEATPQVSELLAAAAQVSVLATSRERLHIYGEQEYPVRPLELPDPARKENAESMLEYEAVNLFVQRARAVQPGFRIEDTQVEALAQICIRLDGLPLALELAASQVKFYPPAILAKRLLENLSSLPAGPRDLPARQRTLKATIQWSYDLLSEEEKTLFTLLAVFHGSATMEAIESICAPYLSGSLPELLSSLMDKNLVLARGGGGNELRYSMLETIREYAWEMVQVVGMADTISQAHADYYTRLAEHAAGEIRDRRQSYWYPYLQAEQDNLRTALAWSLHGSQSEYGIRLAAALRDYWYYNGYLVEGRRWIDLALAKTTRDQPALRAGVLLASGWSASADYDPKRAIPELREAIRLYQSLGDERNTAWSKIMLSICYMSNLKKYQKGTALCKEGLEVFLKLGDLPGIAQSYNILGELARMVGDYEAARSYYETCMDVSIESGEQMRVAMSFTNLGFIHYWKKDFRKSVEFNRQALEIIRMLQNDYGLATMVSSAAGSMAMLGTPERAARLLGASFAVLEANGSAFQPSDLPEIEEYIRITRELLGVAAFDEAWAAGRVMTLAEAVELALTPVPEA